MDHLRAIRDCQACGRRGFTSDPPFRRSDSNGLGERCWVRRYEWPDTNQSRNRFVFDHVRIEAIRISELLGSTIQPRSVT
jgi:hypothetical protein